MENINIVEKTINKFIAKDYFYTKSAIENCIKVNSKVATTKTEAEVKKLCTDEIKLNHFNMSMLTYKTLKLQIERKNLNFLIERLRYDQQLSIKFYFLITGVKLPKTNKEIVKYLTKKYENNG